MPAVLREVDAATGTYSLNLVATIDVDTHLRLQDIAMKHKNNAAMQKTLRFIKYDLVLAAFRTTLEGGIRKIDPHDNNLSALLKQLDRQRCSKQDLVGLELSLFKNQLQYSGPVISHVMNAMSHTHRGAKRKCNEMSN